MLTVKSLSDIEGCGDEAKIFVPEAEGARLWPFDGEATVEAELLLFTAEENCPYSTVKWGSCINRFDVENSPSPQ